MCDEKVTTLRGCKNQAKIKRMLCWSKSYEGVRVVKNQELCWWKITTLRVCKKLRRDWVFVRSAVTFSSPQPLCVFFTNRAAPWLSSTQPLCVFSTNAQRRDFSHFNLFVSFLQIAQRRDFFITSTSLCLFHKREVPWLFALQPLCVFFKFAQRRDVFHQLNLFVSFSKSRSAVTFLSHQPLCVFEKVRKTREKYKEVTLKALVYAKLERNKRK